VIATVLAIAWTRAERLVGHDGFFYVKFAKRYTEVWPEQFGNHWPQGYPLVASFFAEIGLSAYWGLITISVLSVVVTAWLTTFLIPTKIQAHWSTTSLFAGLGAAPVAPLVLTTPLADWLFTALVVCVIVLIRYWPRPWALWGSAFGVVSAFCVRYAGIFLLGVIGLYGLWVLYSTEKRRTRLHTTLSVLVAGGVIIALMGLNLSQTGHVGGAARYSGGGLAAFPIHAAHIGWAFIGGLSSPNVAGIIGGVESPVGLTIGYAVLGIALLLCVRIFLQERQVQMLRPAALVVGSYLICMIVFRSMSSFNDLSQPRFILPVLFPTGAIVISQARGKFKSVVGVLAIGVLAIGLFAAGRGISKETYGNIDKARRVLDGSLAPGDTVLVNGRALRLSAYFENTFRWRGVSAFDSLNEALGEVWAVDYAVFAAQRKGRFGKGGYQELLRPYRTICAKADSLERIERVTMDKTVCIVRVENTDE
jgi:hypothetical protein